MNLNPKYYVYEWVRPDINVVFYVGKGTKNRAHDFEYNRNRHTKSVMIGLEKKGMKPCVRIIARFINEDSAYDFEEERIQFWGLENLTNDLPGGRNGGGGMKGKKHSPETIAKMCAAQKGRVISLDARRKLRDFNLGKNHTIESRNKMSAHRTGAKNANAKITEDMARNIYAADGTISQIARDFCVARHIVDSIKKKITWKHIHGGGN